MKCKQCKKKIKDNEKFRQINLATLHIDCIDDYIKFHIHRARKLRKERKPIVKSVPKTSKIDQTQTVFNRYIRLRDTVESHNGERVGSCISCGKRTVNGKANASAGHYYSRGARSDLRFNEDNVFLQCNNCNVYGDAETMVKFKENVIKKIGQKRFEALKEKKQQDYSETNLKKIRKKYNKKISELIKAEKK